MSRGKVEDHGRFRSRFKRSVSPQSCSQLRKGVLIVFITLNYYQNCYGISLREKENSVKKRPKKIIYHWRPSVLTWCFLWSMYNARALLEWYICQSLEIWKMQNSYNATRVKVWNLFLLSKNFIAKNSEVKKIRAGATRALVKVKKEFFWKSKHG